jgi:outer membrane protein
MKLLSAMAIGLAVAPAAWSADLLQLYREAQTYDSTLASARAQYQANSERVAQAKASLGTQVNLSATTGYQSIYRKGLAPFVIGGNTNGATALYTLSLARPLYRKQNEIQLDEAKTSLSQFEAQLAAAEQDLILRVSQAYFDVLQAQDNLDVSKGQKVAISEQLAQAKRNFEVGTATIVDQKDAQARYDLAVAKEISDTNDLEVKRRTLETLVGHDVPVLSVLGDKVELPLPKPNDVAQWVTTSETQNLQVIAARVSQEVAQQEIERNRAAFTPNIDLVATLNDAGNTNSYQRPLGGEPRSTIIGVQLGIPLWDSGLRDANVRQSRANFERARQDLETARRNVALNARQSFIGVTSGVTQVKALERSVESSQSSLDSTKLGQQVGVRTQVDVLNAQQQLFQARRDLYAARYATIINQLRLKSAAGTLAENDLLEVNTGLGQPQAAAAAAPSVATPAAAAPTPQASPAAEADKPAKKSKKKKSAKRSKAADL